MSKAKTSRIWKISDGDFQNLLNSSISYSDILRKLNFDTKTGGAYRTLKSRINESNFNTELFDINRKNHYKTNLIRKDKTKIDDILIKNSTYSRCALKRRLISENIMEYKCYLCSIIDVWNGKPIAIQLDHINGINNDNRLENLRFLCPNCHSQTDSYSGKRLKTLHRCLDCGKNIYKISTRCKCCASKINGKKQRRYDISKEELTNLIKQYPMTKVGEILGVSDNAIRKRCRTLEIDYKNL
jgi:5-methylcytosine-specific restriction endonuclease McrA